MLDEFVSLAERAAFMAGFAYAKGRAIEYAEAHKEISDDLCCDAAIEAVIADLKVMTPEDGE